MIRATSAGTTCRRRPVPFFAAHLATVELPDGSRLDANVAVPLAGQLIFASIPGNDENSPMDRLNRTLAGCCGLFVLLAATGCKSMRSSVPPGRPYSADGRQAPAVGFSNEPHPMAGNAIGMGSNTGGAAGSQFGTPMPGMPNYGAPTNNAFGPPITAPLGPNPAGPLNPTTPNPLAAPAGGASSGRRRVQAKEC